MPVNRVPGFIESLQEQMGQLRRKSGIDPIWLAGSSGSGGGTGTPPGGFIGKLIQTKVAYDTDEATSPASSGSSSLLDNLNHIRYRVGSLESSVGLSYTPGSILFASSSGSIAEDNAHLYWEASTQSILVGSNQTLSTVANSGISIMRTSDRARYRATTIGDYSTLHLARVQGTIASPTCPTANMQLASISAGGWNGTTLISSSVWRGYSTQNWSSGSCGGRWDCYLMPNNSETAINTFRLDQDGDAYRMTSGAAQRYLYEVSANVIGGFTGGFTLTAVTSGSLPVGTGAANQIAYWSGTNTLTSGANLTWNGSGPLTLNTGADANKGLIVKGFSATQSANLQEWQTSGGVLMSGVGGAGNIGIQATPSATIPLLVGTIGTSYADSLVSIRGNPPDSTPTLYIKNTVAGIGAGVVQIETSVATIGAGTVYMLKFTPTWKGSTGGGQELYGYFYGLTINSAGQTLLNNYGYFSNTPVLTAGGLTRSYGFYAANQGVATMTAAYGYYIEAQTAATTCYSIYGNAGLYRFGDQLSIVGSADRIQLQVKANATQTTNLQTWETSGGAVLGGVGGAGNFFVGTTVDTTSWLNVTGSTYTSTAAYGRGIACNFIVQVADNSAQRYHAIQASIALNGTKNYTNYCYAFDSTAYHFGTGTVSYLVGVNCVAGIIGSVGVVTNAYGGRFTGYSTRGTVVNMFSCYISNPFGGGAFTNNYGLYLEAQTGGGTLNYSIYGNAGLYRFGDDVILNGADSDKLWFGAGKDMSLYYDGTSGFIKTDEVAASDLHITCGAAKTLVLDTVVYQDINIAGALLSKPASSAPGTDTFRSTGGTDTTIETYAFAVDEKVHGGFELQHDYKEGTDLVFHVHWQGIAAPTGTDNVQWRLNYIVARDGVTLAAAVVFDSPDTAIDTQYRCYRTDFAAITGTNFKIGDQFMFTLTRVASTGDAYAGDALIETAGIHYQIDTLGSRSISAK